MSEYGADTHAAAGHLPRNGLAISNPSSNFMPCGTSSDHSVSQLCPIRLRGVAGGLRKLLVTNPENSSRPIEQHASAGNELEQDIVVADIGGQNDQAQLLRLQIQDAVLQRAQLVVLAVSLKPTQDA